MMHAIEISFPKGCTTALHTGEPLNLVIVAPPGMAADPSVMFSTGLCGMFSHDDDVSWPDAAGCVAANSYLKAGHPICLAFGKLADAISCHERMRREIAA